MAVNVMTESEVKAFGAKLESFGNQLSPKEQSLLAEILLRAASATEPEVVGLAMQIEWPALRQRVQQILLQIVESMAVMSPLEPALPPE